MNCLYWVPISDENKVASFLFSLLFVTGGGKEKEIPPKKKDQDSFFFLSLVLFPYFNAYLQSDNKNKEEEEAYI